MYYFVPGEGGEGRRGEAHHDVGQRHVAHEQVHARVQTRAPANTHLVLLELQTMHQLHRRQVERAYNRVIKSHHKFMLASYMRQIAKFLALLHSDNSVLHIV